ncbi:MAG: carboxypeptidase regulatory-like domain-containing protein, partial [Candidatus Diapherotrites archaeon]|nr:carboxypeptidase regulatory-like domain-containing protein [Candidatus Diapherotrites archaeon]
MTLQDRWYAALDWLEERGIPVYAVIDPIDKVIPSFYIFIGIVLLALFALLAPVLFPPAIIQTETTGTLELTVMSGGQPMPGARIVVKGENYSEEKKTAADGTAAFESIELGTLMSVSLTQDGFTPIQFTVPVNGARVKKTVEMVPLTASDTTPKTIRFVAPNGTPLRGIALDVSFACTNPKAELSQTRFSGVTSGEVTLEIPFNCGSLSYTVNAAGYRSRQDLLSLRDSTITLSALETDVPTATLVVSVINQDTRRPLSGISVELQETDRHPIDSGLTDATGEAYFPDQPLGTYLISARAPAGNFGQKNATVTLAEPTKRIVLELSEESFAEITVNAVDAQTTESIPATIRLSRHGILQQEIELDEWTTQALFKVDEPDDYEVQAFAEEYKPSAPENISIQTRGQTEETTLSLEPCTPQTCGQLTVEVHDDENGPVENASVYFIHPQSGMAVAGVPTAYTDAEGTTRFSGIPPGTYKVRVQKGWMETDSAAFTVEENPKAQTVSVTLAAGTVSLNAFIKDSFNQPVSRATVQVKSLSGDVLEEFSATAEGTLAAALKANREVFFEIRHPDFLSFKTPSFILRGGQSIVLNAVLEKQITGDAPAIRFVELTEKATGQPTDAPQPAGVYWATFEIRSPKAFPQAGAHVRTANADRLEDDPWFLGEPNAPGAVVEKGQTYDPQAQNDLPQTGAHAKWMNLRWNSLPAGITQFRVEVKIPSTTAPQTELPLYFRAWGISDSNYYRDPADAQLGTAESVPAKKGLYADTYTQVFFPTTATPPCENEFCFDQNVLDQKNNVFLLEPYQVRLNDDYRFTFRLKNNSGTDKSHALFKVGNRPTASGGSIPAEEIAFTSYEIKNADLQSATGSQAVFETPELDSGNWSDHKDVSGRIGIQATQTAGEIQFPFKFEQQTLSTGAGPVSFEAFTEQGQEFTSFPSEKVPSRFPQVLHLQARFVGGPQDGQPMPGTRIHITQINPDRTRPSLGEF